ncbi:hypothetical protein [Cetobacterium sp.]|uniref:hypothetical protein n=1 Tax=Cetobacterium sp. TaxID=2071632 RepID=UPI003EE45FAD
MSYIIKIQKGCWVAGYSDSSLPRTVVFENVKVFKSLDEANKIKEKLISKNNHRKLNLQILDYETAKKEVE